MVVSLASIIGKIVSPYFLDSHKMRYPPRIKHDLLVFFLSIKFQVKLESLYTINSCHNISERKSQMECVWHI